MAILHNFDKSETNQMNALVSLAAIFLRRFNVSVCESDRQHEKYRDFGR